MKLDAHDLPPLSFIPMDAGQVGRVVKPSKADFWEFYDALPAQLRHAYNYAANGMALKHVHAETCLMVYGDSP